MPMPVLELKKTNLTVCEMLSRGLKTKKDYEMSPEEKIKLHNALSEIFNWKSEK